MTGTDRQLPAVAAAAWGPQASVRPRSPGGLTLGGRRPSWWASSGDVSARVVKMFVQNKIPMSRLCPLLPFGGEDVSPIHKKLFDYLPDCIMFSEHDNFEN